MEIDFILPDGSKRSLPAPVSLYDVAKNISPGLAKIALAGKINDKTVDLSTVVSADDRVEIITHKAEIGQEIVRHSTAHLMAMAIQEVFPGTQITIGPVVENQFYYDIYPKPEVKISVHDFPSIEAKMREIVAKNIPIKRVVLSRNNAIEHFKNLDETFKVELISDIPEDQEISVYQMEDWGDLCRGPHVYSTGQLGAFKLMSIAGAYWRADKNNPQLLRIYGTAWGTQKELDAYLKMLEEAKRRDHVMLGKQLNLFSLMGDVAPGAPFLFPHGSKIFTLLQNYTRKKWREFGFEEVQTPQILNVNLWHTSGHYDKFKDDMYLFDDHNGEQYGVKPMNCPCHVRMFMVGQKSYRDLPLRFGEFGVVHRNELSGTLHGLTRVRRFMQDDGHIFCTMEQISAEIEKAVALVQQTYADFGFNEVFYYFSTRPENKLGNDEVWDTAEAALEVALKNAQVPYQLNAGDGAFYGPKIDFKVKDAIGRLHQCATIQLDFQMPERFGAWYQTSENTHQTPVMIHRAVFGSIERFLGVFIEHTAGHFPMGLAPVQCRVVTVTNDFTAFAHEVFNELRKKGVRIEIDATHEKLGAKIRAAQLQKIPYMVVIGEKESEAKTVTVRCNNGKNLAPLTIDGLCALIKSESGVFWGLDTNQV